MDVATYLPGLGIGIPMKVREREAELRHTGIDQRIQSQGPGHNQFAASSRLDGRRQDIGDRRRSNHRFPESGLQRPCGIEHLVTAIGRIEPGEGSGAGRAEKERVEALAVDSVKARAGIDAPQYGNCHHQLRCPACNE
ncbi:hypothetical protein D9M73_139320 [compost metagenome]